MSAGTLSLTNKSDAVLGTGTAFTTDLKAGDFIVFVVGGTGYTLPVKSIASNTQLTLSGNYTGPTQSNISWFAVPREAQSLITAGLASQITEALRGLNADKYNWQQVFSVSDDITVTLPDGTKFSGPSWLKVADLIKSVDLTQIQSIAAQIDADAQQVASDKNTATGAASDAINAATTATQEAVAATSSADSASTSASTATQKAAEASASAVTATQQADRAKNEADRAAASNPANYLVKDNNLSDLQSPSVARTNLGLGAAAVENTIPVEKGGTGSTTAAAARTALGVPSGVDKQMCTAWVSFNTDGAIRDSFNISSVTKNGQGNFTINFLSPMLNRDYSVVANMKGVSAGARMVTVGDATSTFATNSVQILFFTYANAAIDPGVGFVQIFGGK
ncbi:hypothetical protein ACT0JU_004232 [Cronobacter dublinensis]